MCIGIDYTFCKRLLDITVSIIVQDGWVSKQWCCAFNYALLYFLVIEFKDFGKLPPFIRVLA